MGAEDRQTIIPEVQGLRGLSALAVVLFHMGWLWCGWLGVWVFFTVSGFVISRTLLKAETSGVPSSPGRFYRARAARILPLYLVAILVGATALWMEAWLLDWPQALRFLEQIPWLLTGTFNVFRAIPGYEETRLFGHLWSISVEEQFYLLYPLAFFGLPRVWLARLLVAFLAAGPLARLGTHLGLTSLGWSSSDVSTAVYQLGFNHVDAFALGGLIALNEDRLRGLAGSPTARRLVWAIPVGLALLAALCIALQNLQDPAAGKDIFTYAFSVKPERLSGQILVYALGTLTAAGALVLILTRCRLVGLLAADSLVRLGSLSFGVYVWHFPLLWIYAEAGHRSLLSAGLYLGATLAAAVVSRRYLEEPARRWLLGRGRGISLRAGRSQTSAVQSPVRP